MKVAILGGTKGMGRAVSRRLAERGDRICLLGRNEADLQKSVADLCVRSGHGAPATPAVHVYAHCDLEDPATFEPALEEARSRLEGLDAVIVTAARYATQEQLEADPALAHRLLVVNFANTIAFCEAAKRQLLRSGGGTLCVFSSVAGERGRKPVILYGATKAGLSRYLEGLDHKYRGRGLKVVTIKPGFVKTGMTEGLQPPPFAGEPDQVARIVVRAIDSGRPVAYAPRIWALVMLVIRWLPRFVMRRINF
ncbi:MAG: SDR family NAD(P)-dependent oxidoreductase [Myxococcaceae bacterium]|nr:SDR family NAD(P)-dependent oxidoreductase [Myxococcaceae bacterium]